MRAHVGRADPEEHVAVPQAVQRQSDDAHIGFLDHVDRDDRAVGQGCEEAGHGLHARADGADVEARDRGRRDASARLLGDPFAQVGRRVAEGRIGREGVSPTGVASPSVTQ